MRCNFVRFGIPSLDMLLTGGSNPDRCGIELSSSSEATSISIIGPEGTGKSILALHLASRYLGDAIGATPATKAKVLYISTDLSHSRARRVWESFDLAHPTTRVQPFSGVPEPEPPCEIGFLRLCPDGAADALSSEDQQFDAEDASVAHYLLFPRTTAVAFIDLAASTAGDDWAYVKRIIASLPELETGDMRHLVIIDALEGFETLVGDRDSFGTTLSRRSRIAQAMRLASGKAHIVFVVEDTELNVRVPEEFVTDAVLRLRSGELNGYNRRTVEIEKVRGQTHARGKHPITIRKGAGSTTGRGAQETSFINADDPHVPRSKPCDGYGEQAYVHVFHSLHHQSRSIMERRETEVPGRVSECAAFGIRYLDDMLAESGRCPNTRGLPLGSITALIGHPDTQKTLLGHSFLSGTFADLVDAIETDRGGATGCAGCDESARRWGPALANTGAAILLTTQDMDARLLAREFARWQCGSDKLRPTVESQIIRRVICRRLENHDLPAAILFHIVSAAVEEARARIAKEGSCFNRIRLVIEDFNTWKKIYPEIINEPRFLPFLLFYLRRRDVTTLIINTQAGRPDTPLADPFDSEFRALVDHQICTWRVPFYGESRIAIAAIPPLSPSRLSVVRELLWSPSKAGDYDERPDVDPHFELYTGLEEGKPKPVPLMITLFDEAPQFRKYIEEENVFFGTRFSPVPGGSTEGSVIRALTAREHETLRSLGTEQDTRLDYTHVFQVDEFWYNYSGQSHRSGQGALRPQEEYLESITWEGGRGDVTVDPRALFRPTGKSSGCDAPIRRIDLFDDLNCGLTTAANDDLPEHAPVSPTVDRHADRVPFMWDFGFLLCNASLWKAAYEVPVPRWDNQPEKSVNQIWNLLPKAHGCSDELTIQPSQGEFQTEPDDDLRSRPSWRMFLGACKEVAAAKARATGVRAVRFDLALTTAESLACLVLEIWASEVFDRFDKRTGCEERHRRYWQHLHTRRTGGRDRGLYHGLSRYSCDLYKTFLLLADSLDLRRCADASNAFECVARDADAHAVAVRHWYKSACAAQMATRGDPDVALLPVGLPGRFSVRGDWFLAAANASRSSRLADRALDVLSSRRGNFTRMQLGLGLPTRRITNEQAARIRTCLTGPVTDDGKELRNVSYADLNALGEDVQRRFYWLWRSSITDYDMMSRLWQKWIARAVIAWTDFRADQGARWTGGFKIYDRMNACGVTNIRDISKMRDDARFQAWRKEDAAGFEQFVTSAENFEALCGVLRTLIDEAMPYEPGQKVDKSAGAAAAG